jgi:hypothetical protein
MQNKPNLPIKDRSLSEPVPASRGLVGISDFVCKLNNYAKQTQFAESQNERKYLWAQELYKYMPSRTAKKQTQFQTHRPAIAQPIINMQNKPNFRKAKINVSDYGQTDYINIRLCEPRQNKPNPNSRPVALPVRCSGDGIAYFHVSNLVFRASNLFRISIFLISCFHPIYAKQTQFPKHQNEPNHLCEQGL